MVIAKMSRILKPIDTNQAETQNGISGAKLQNISITPTKTSFRKEIAGNKSAMKYKAADLLDNALKHERNGDKERALSAYEDAAENISKNEKILSKIKQLRADIEQELTKKAMDKKKEFLEERQNYVAEQSNENDFYNEANDDISMESNDSFSDSDDVSDAGTLYSEYDPEKRAKIIANLQAKTISALEFQLLDKLNKGDMEELLQLRKIGPVRAKGILELREKFQEESPEELYFKSLEQLEDIFMKPKEIKFFLKENATVLLGL